MPGCNFFAAKLPIPVCLSVTQRQRYLKRTREPSAGVSYRSLALWLDCSGKTSHFGPHMHSTSYPREACRSRPSTAPTIKLCHPAASARPYLIISRFAIRQKLYLLSPPQESHRGGGRGRETFRDMVVLNLVKPYLFVLRSRIH